MIINSNVSPPAMNLPGKQKTFMPLKKGNEPYKLKRTSAPDNVEARKVKLRKAAEGFEAIFIRQFMKVMRSTVPNGGMFGSGAVGEIYSDMMDNSIAEILSKRSTLGIADTLYRQLVKEIDYEEKN